MTKVTRKTKKPTIEPIVLEVTIDDVDTLTALKWIDRSEDLMSALEDYEQVELKEALFNLLTTLAEEATKGD